MADHPDSEQLAAFQAGDGDRRQRAEVEAHLAGCPSCAEVVASVDQARAQLALLEEPDLPAGLHDRLAAAVDAEAAASGVADGARSRFRRPALVPGRSGPEGNEEPPAGRVGAGQRRGRPAPWYRRPVAWGAAAALLLAALVAVPVLDQSGDVTTAGGAQAVREADTSATGAVPLLHIPGEVSAATVRSRLATDRQARAALDAASARRGAGGDAAATPGGAGTAGEATVPQAQNPAARSESATTLTAPPPDLSTSAGRSTASARPPATAPAALAPCLTAATAAADPATLPLTPAFYVEGTYQGRPATILVTTSDGRRGRVDLWAFPRGDCSSPLLAGERVR